MSDDARVAELVRELEGLVGNARAGLSNELFYFVSRLTPLVNVDLFVQNEAREVLLTWRKDRFYDGWHVPGGIIRFKEFAADRIRAVARAELGVEVEADDKPLLIHEKHAKDRDVRGHFIALLYRTRLRSQPDPALRCTDLEAPQHGQWAWHRSYPERMIPQHAVYRHLFEP